MVNGLNLGLVSFFAALVAALVRCLPYTKPDTDAATAKLCTPSKYLWQVLGRPEDLIF